MNESPSPFQAGEPEVLSRLLQLGLEDIQMEDGAVDLAPTDLVGKVISGYELLRELGCGGAGVVYLARQATLQRLVALKIMGSHQFQDRASGLRFQREAELIASLQHPRIVGIFEIGRWKELPFYSMQYIEGTDLKARIRANVLPWQQAATWAASIAETVHFAHGKGVLHRDLKPQNILLDLDEQLHLADFGLAKKVEEAQGITLTGTLVGTPHYIAPEVLSSSGREVSVASDLYAIGAILYEMLTGIPPFAGNNLGEICENIRRLDPVPPSRIRSGIPQQLEAVCLKALRKKPKQRYSDVQEFAAALKLALIEPSGQATAPGFFAHSFRARSVARGLALSLFVFGALLALVTVIYSVRSEVSKSQPKDAAQAGPIATLIMQGRITEAAQEAQDLNSQKPTDPGSLRWLAALDVAQFDFRSAVHHWVNLSDLGTPSVQDQKIGQILYQYEWEATRLPKADEDRAFRVALVNDLRNLKDSYFAVIADYLDGRSLPALPPVVLPINSAMPEVVHYLPGDPAVIVTAGWTSHADSWKWPVAMGYINSLQIILPKPCLNFDFSMTCSALNDIDMAAYTTETPNPTFGHDYEICLGAYDDGRSFLRLFGNDADSSIHDFTKTGDHKIQLSRRSGWVVVLQDGVPILARPDPHPTLSITKLVVWGCCGSALSVSDLSYRVDDDISK